MASSHGIAYIVLLLDMRTWIRAVTLPCQFAVDLQMSRLVFQLSDLCTWFDCRFAR
jgi:hypothetical protein